MSTRVIVKAENNDWRLSVDDGNTFDPFRDKSDAPKIDSRPAVTPLKAQETSIKLTEEFESNSDGDFYKITAEWTGTGSGPSKQSGYVKVKR